MEKNKKSIEVGEIISKPLISQALNVFNLKLINGVLNKDAMINSSDVILENASNVRAAARILIDGTYLGREIKLSKDIKNRIIELLEKSYSILDPIEDKNKVGIYKNNEGMLANNSARVLSEIIQMQKRYILKGNNVEVYAKDFFRQISEDGSASMYTMGNHDDILNPIVKKIIDKSSLILDLNHKLNIKPIYQKIKTKAYEGNYLYMFKISSEKVN